MENQEKKLTFEIRGNVGVMTGDSSEIDWESFDKIANAWQDSMIEYEKQIANELGVSDTCSSMICYIRTRSRYTPEMEQRLIDMDKNGEVIPISQILNGEWR